MNIKVLSLCCLLSIGMVAQSMDAMQANASRWSSAKKWAAIGAGAAVVGGVAWWLWDYRSTARHVAEHRAFLENLRTCEDVEQLLIEIERSESADKFIEVNSAQLMLNPVTNDYRLVLAFLIKPHMRQFQSMLVSYTYSLINGLANPSLVESRRILFSQSHCCSYIPLPDHGYSIIGENPEALHWIADGGFTQVVKEFVAPDDGTIRINIDPEAIEQYAEHPDATHENVE